MNLGLVILAIFIFLILVILVSSIKVVNTGYVLIRERLGQFKDVLQPGWHILIPFIDSTRPRISTKQQIFDIEPQSVITKDNVKISVDNVIFYKVLNPRDAVYNIDSYKEGIRYSTITNMRNILGNMTLDEILSGRDKINSELLKVVDELTDAYGIKILSVEIKNIMPPTEIQQAMEKQMKAEREKRAVILLAEGQKESEIAKAQGEKQSKILQAEAEKEANIRRSEGLRESQLLEAEGRADAIKEVAEAESAAIRKINAAILESGTNETIIAIKQIEALKELAKNPSNKLILPNETMSSLGNIAAIVETLNLNKK